MMPAKEVSVGEFDATTGLTFITLQRGRLMFNMGPPSAKRAASTADETAVVDEDAAAPNSTAAATDQVPPPRPPPRLRVFRSGVFTGRTLYAEEAVYLVQRGALVVYAMEENLGDGDDAMHPNAVRSPLTVAQLLSLIVRNRFATLAVLDVYAFLKDRKLHPRRHVTAAEASSGLFLFDVFKSISETQYVVVDPLPPLALENTSSKAATPADHPVTTRKRKVKRLAQIFAVGVSSFGDAMPRPRELGKLQAVGPEDQDAMSLKWAVADRDRSVLLFELS